MTTDPAFDDAAPADDLDGHTIDELSAYLDAGEMPPNPSIDNSPGCRIALKAMRRLRELSQDLMEDDARREPQRDDSWVGGILDVISREARAGRDIPVQHPSPSARLAITEGAVRGMIRAAGDAVGGVIIGRCRLDGDVTVPGEGISIRVDASVFWGERIPEAVDRVRQAIYTELLRHTELNVTAIDVTIHDVHLARTNPEELS